MPKDRRYLSVNARQLARPGRILERKSVQRAVDAPTMFQISPPPSSRADEHFQCVGSGGIAKCLIQREMGGDQARGFDRLRCRRLDKHRDPRGIDEPRGDVNVAIPQRFQMTAPNLLPAVAIRN